MIRVLQIVTYMGRGGLETMLMNYYRHIDHSKVQFDFLVHRDFEASYDKEIQMMGGRIYHVSRLVPWSRSYRSELKEFFRGHSEYKIIHVHQDCLSSVALQCAKECGIPVRIAHSHNSNQTRDVKYLFKKYYMKQIPKFATELFACGKEAGDWMFGGNAYEILRNAVDISKYEYSKIVAKDIRNKMGMDDNIVIGHVGNFSLAKNHTFLIEIFQEVVKIEPKARLFLVGEGPRMQLIQKMVRRIGLEDKVLFLGKRADVNQLLQAMDVFVFPSLYEGLPVSMIEAQAAGLPCIISDHVSEECIVTKNLVTIMKLSDASCNWAKHIVERSKEQRNNHLEEIQAAGYDVVTAAKELETFYLKKYGEC